MSALTPAPELFLTVTRAFLPRPLAGGGLVFASDLAGHPQPFRLDEAGRWPRRLASRADRLFALSETGHGLLVRHDRAGDEVWQLGLLGPDGTLRTLSSDSKAIHQSVTLNPDGRSAGLAYNPGGQSDMVLGTLDLDTGDITDWLRPHGYWIWLAWRPDGGQAVVSHGVSPTRLETHLLDPDGTLTRLLPGARRLHEIQWSACGLFGLSDLDSEFMALVEIDPVSPERPRRTLLAPDHDLEALVLDPGGEQAVVAINEGAYDALYTIDLPSGALGARLPLPDGVVYTDMSTNQGDHIAWSADGRSIFVAWETPTQPADVYELTAGATRRWTHAGGEPVAGTVVPERAGYRSFDGLQVPALHFRVDDRPRPTVVYFHGGPEGQFRGNYQPTLQMLCAAGINVFAPNVRGSTGYGVSYFSLDDKELRWDSVRDGCEAAHHLKREGLATKTAAMGRSYGGFMTLAVLVEDPELWDAAVEFVGIADWHSFFKNTSGWRRRLRAEEYGDPEGAERDVLAEMSPLRLAHTIRAPLLVIHGRNDPRVPVGESEQIARVAPQAELLIFEDEGHGIAKQANMVVAYSRTLDFFRSKLL